MSVCDRPSKSRELTVKIGLRLSCRFNIVELTFSYLRGSQLSLTRQDQNGYRRDLRSYPVSLLEILRS